MDGRNDMNDKSLACAECRGELQEYLDGTLEKTRSVAVFLHLRACADCQREHDRLQALFGLLAALPRHEVPADFDAPILAAVPLAAYRAMEPLRRQRVPVFLEEQALPAFFRARPVRAAGLVIAAATVGAVLAAAAPPGLLAVAGAGAAPELLVRLQGLARRLTLAVRRAEG
jgi:anti-sigma factor RsiW